MSRSLCCSAILLTLGYGPMSAAGDISSSVGGCENSAYSYHVYWGGPWSESSIFMERKPYPSGSWVFYIGYLDTTGKIFPSPGGYWLRMMAQPAAGDPYLDSNIEYLPATYCEIDP